MLHYRRADRLSTAYIKLILLPLAVDILTRDRHIKKKQKLDFSPAKLQIQAGLKTAFNLNEINLFIPHEHAVNSTSSVGSFPLINSQVEQQLRSLTAFD